MQCTYAFGFLFFGNILDNILSPKKLLIFIQILLISTLVITAVQDQSISSKIFVQEYFALFNLNNFLLSGIHVICIVTVFNWLTPKYMGFF
jgi:hypothetical protein